MILLFQHINTGIKGRGQNAQDNDTHHHPVHFKEKGRGSERNEYAGIPGASKNLCHISFPETVYQN